MRGDQLELVERRLRGGESHHLHLLELMEERDVRAVSFPAAPASRRQQEGERGRA